MKGTTGTGGAWRPTAWVGVLALAACTSRKPVEGDPGAVILSPEDGASVPAGTVVTFLGQGTDTPELLDTLVAAWTAADPATPELLTRVCPSAPTEADGSTSCTFDPSVEGAHVCLRIDDPYAQAQTCITLDIVHADAPSVLIAEPDPALAFYADVPVPLTAVVDDPDDPFDSLGVTWASSLDGELGAGGTPDTTGVSTAEALLTEGAHTLTATVADPDGHTAHDTVDITVYGANTTPTCDIVLPTDGTVGSAGGTVLLRGTVGDGETPVKELDVAWASDLDGALGTSAPDRTGAVALETTALVTPGTHALTLTATDDRGATCTDRITYVIDSPPTATITLPTDGAVYVPGSPVTFEATVADVEDAPDALRLEWRSNLDGVLSTAPADAAGYVTFSTDTLSEGAHNVALTVVDSAGGFVRELIGFEVGACADVWYADLDLDGYGDPASTTTGCAPPAGYVDNDEDCDDTRAAAYPGAPEACDGLDDDCDGTADEDATVGLLDWYADLDGDGWGDPSAVIAACDPPAGYVGDVADCNDADATVSPAAVESCNGVDDDCDGTIDDDAGVRTFHADTDGDSYGDPSVTVSACSRPAGYVTDDTDCDDTDPEVNPAATESPADGVDQDCTGDELCWRDADRDGYGGTTSVAAADVTCTATGVSVVATDCDDARATIHPDADEVCDGTDQDCDGAADDAPIDGARWHPDADGDTYGDPAVDVVACDAPEGYVADASDCDDTVATTHPRALDTCDGVDNDCDGSYDEDYTRVLWYADTDGDTYGDPGASVPSCAAPAGYVSDDTDCDDTLASVYPGATEIPGDEIDESCDGREACYLDFDRDGHGSTTTVTGSDTDCADAREARAADDCVDTDGSIHPGAAEVCNGVDDDCDLVIDGDSATDATEWYADADGDGYGDPAIATWSCDAPAGYVADATDCNDTTLTVHPGLADRCDGVDNNCDGSYDEDAARTTFWADTDADGFGDAAAPVLSCLVPAGHAAVDTDCDDTDPDTWPGAYEIPGDGVDQSCDGREACFADADGDTYGGSDTVESADLACDADGESWVETDCDDGTDAVFPGAPESCNGVDDDCDGTVDGASATGSRTWYLDTDGDGFGDAGATLDTCESPAGYVLVAGDCDDGDASVHPGVADTCDGIDQDCDGAIDDDAAVTSFYGDADADGYGDAADVVSACVAPPGYVSTSTDCDDADPTVNPGAAEGVADGLDANCDGRELCYRDADTDGYGSTTTTTSASLTCSGVRVSAVSTDCDDTRATVSPAATETCDGRDDDCDGTVDEDDATDAPAWYVDADADGYGGATTTVRACSQPAGTFAAAEDCDDADPAVHPGVADECDGIDQDCDGSFDEDVGRTYWYPDADGDTYGDGALPTASCLPPSGYVGDTTDCDDTRATVYPGAPEIPGDAIDEDCDGAELCYADADGDHYGTSTTVASADTDCADAGESTAATDCDDAAAAVSPAADEYCNGLDDNCNGAFDETSAVDALQWYADADGDDWGDASVTTWACVTPYGYVADDTDCDDGDAAVNPAAAETPGDGVDADCNSAELCYRDNDGDTYGATTTRTSADLACTATGEADDATDCDDTRAVVNPGATEVPGDGVDQDCTATELCWHDGDGDGYGSTTTVTSADASCAAAGESAVSTDCDDTRVAVSPAATETCDGFDNDCDTRVDEDGAAGAVTWYRDADGDTYGDPGTTSTTATCAAPAGYVGDATDCDDVHADAHPGVTESCATAYDDDCDGATDAVDALGCSPFWADADGDTWGAGAASCQCEAGSGYTATVDGDCDDAAAGTHPAATEVCDPADVDEDCDGLADDADASVEGQGTWNFDLDGDGYGDETALVTACDQPGDATSAGGDCDDSDGAVHPGAEEVCSDGVDQDCDTIECGWIGSYGVDDPGVYSTRILGEIGTARYGASISDRLDLNGDGVGDLVVVAPFDDRSGSATGTVYGYLGPFATGDHLASEGATFLLTGDSDSYRLDTVDTVGDLDGDGNDDLFVRRSDDLGWLITSDPTGEAALDTITTATIECDAAAPAGQYGGRLASRKWVCGQGSAGGNIGEAVVYGGSIAYATISGEAAGDHAGAAVAGGLRHDATGDGIDDVWVGAPNADLAYGEGEDAGAVYLIEGPRAGAIGLGSADLKMTGEAAGDELGSNVEVAGDVDGDGYDDLLVAAAYADAGGGASGLVYLFTGLSGVADPADAVAEIGGEAASDTIGNYGLGVGDFDGDGARDLVMCTPYSDAAAASAGATWLLFGPLSGSYSLASLPGHAARLDGTNRGDYAGADCAALGDTDSDGLDDFAVGGWGYDHDGGFFAGATWVYLGDG